MMRFPSRQDILDWIADNPGETGRREIARAFGLRGTAERAELKRLLREMEAAGEIAPRRRPSREPGGLPPVTVLTIEGPDGDGDLFARPLEWDGEGPAPRVLYIPGKGDPALGAGDRILARLAPVSGEGHGHEARLIRHIGREAQRLVGIFRKGSTGGRIVPVDKGADREWRVARADSMDARDGELVEAVANGPRGRLGLPQARVVARLGDPTAPKAVSLIAIHQHGIPDAFPDPVLDEAAALAPFEAAEEREDLRPLPLVTIDPEDARDRDDAVFAAPDDDPANPGGHVIWVAIADVAHYVRPGSALDREARHRGNSTYFPDRVVPMLPDALSGDLCSLHEAADRPCLAVRMVLDAQGEKRGHRFTRGVMRSRASLAYEAVQAAIDGVPDDRTAPLLDGVLRPLYAAYAALRAAREKRQPLDLDLPERRIVLSDEGRVLSVALKERLDAHRLIEEFMVLANVAAAEELGRLRQPLLYRVHEEPSPEKLDALREVAEASGFTLAKGQVLQTRHLNRLLAQAEGTDFDELINISTLRSMTQAYYHPENFGHFGLALKAYAHFTSPIRRYSDLIVHRALIAAHRWGKDGLSKADAAVLDETATHISETERRSMAAERDTADRYLAAWLSERVGGAFAGRISGVQRFGAFVKLDETGADGLIPIRGIGHEYFHYDAEAQMLTGSDTGLRIGIGQRVMVRLAEAVPETGGLLLELLQIEDEALPAGRARTRGRGKPLGRKPGRTAARKGGGKVRRGR